MSYIIINRSSTLPAEELKLAETAGSESVDQDTYFSAVESGTECSQLVKLLLFAQLSQQGRLVTKTPPYTHTPSTTHPSHTSAGARKEIHLPC